MKKGVFMIALVLLASASFSTADAKKKKEKKQPQAPVTLPVELKNGSDTLSYVAGMYMTEGLIPFVQQQGVDTTYMADFIRGFKEILEGKYDELPEAAFYMVGGIEEVLEKAEKMKKEG